GMFLLNAPALADEWHELNERGRSAFRQGRFAESEKWLTSAIKVAEQAGPTDLRVAISLENLAWLAYKRGQYQRGVPLAQRALAIYGRNSGLESEESARSLATLAVLKSALG